MRRPTLIAILLFLAFTIATTAFVFDNRSWPQGMVTVHAAFGSSPALIDGCADWSCSAMTAMARWNTFLGNVQFRGIANSDVTPGDGNLRNEMAFASDALGRPFGDNTLAVTISWFRGSRMVENDSIFNSKWDWNSYRGNRRGNTFDFHRVAIHELGHVLGLGHPDESGQNVTAIMNSIISNVDDLTQDDIDGVHAIYGGGSGMTIQFPARNETVAFRIWLEARYGPDGLNRDNGPSYADVEGSVVWVQEYLRYRLNACTHDQAVVRIRFQIDGGGVLGVCGTAPSSTTIEFPGRQDTLQFRTQLENIYQVDLGRAAVQTRVDAEGDVTWIQEYLRYRLNACSDDQAIARVEEQIVGRGVPPTCR
jgi:hypothetical protein